MADTGVIIFAHGSSVASANDAVRRVAAAAAAAGNFPDFETAFLEKGQPDLAGAVSLLVQRAVRRIAVVPYFLTLGIHLREDLPRLIAAIEEDHPGVRISVAPPLDGHPALSAILVERASALLDDAAAELPR